MRVGSGEVAPLFKLGQYWHQVEESIVPSQQQLRRKAREKLPHPVIVRGREKTQEKNQSAIKSSNLCVALEYIALL